MRRITSLFTVFLAAVSFGLSNAWAVDLGAFVTYDPVSKDVFGALPVTSSYVLNITAPISLTGFPVTVTLRKDADTWPLGDADTALTYVQFSSPTLTFTAPGQTIPVTVTMNFPASALSNDVTAGAYTYVIHTDGWMDGAIDGGATINSAVSLPAPPSGNPPSIAITSPGDGTVLNYSLGVLPVQVPFSFQATTDSTSPLITNVSAVLFQPSATNLTVATTGLGTTTVNGSGSFTITAPGVYTFQATATNNIGSVTDTNAFTVTVTAPPPTVAIASPTPGATYNYRLGDTATVVPLTFSAHSFYGGVRTLVATVDGVVVSSGINGLDTSDASATVMLPYTVAGSHTVSVVATDDNGTATAQSNFSINLVVPTPTVTITAPTANQTFTLPVGATTMNVAYAFTSTSNNGFVVDSVTAMLGTTVVTPTTLGLGTAIATSTGTLTGLGVGTYALTATTTSQGILAQTSVTFTIKGAVVPPSVVINTPPVGSTYTRVSGGPALAIPLTFTGTSNTPGGVITKLTASLDNLPLTVITTNLGQQVATGAVTMSVTTAGTHTITVAAVDAYGTANATRTFVVTIIQPRTISGEVFFDTDADGHEDCGEFGLSGITVKLLNSSNQVVAAAVTGCDGNYSFPGIAPGNYAVSAAPFAGLKITTLPSVPSVTIGSCDVSAPDIGLALDFRALQSMTANGFTIGYWKNNIDKALANKTSGTQVSKCVLQSYTCKIGDLALSPYDGISMKSASTIMGSSSSKPTDLLSKQLVGSEYNYENGAYLNGNKNLTFVFVWWGEYVLSHPSSYSSAYIIWTKSWFDAYNNSHGGVVSGPAP
jgi:hypothetical protein